MLTRVDHFVRQARAVARLRSLMVAYAQADSIISGQHMRCGLVNAPKETSAAWTDLDGRRISFNTAVLKPIETQADYIEVTGVNYHELAHVLYTPSQDTVRWGAAKPIYQRANKAIHPQDGEEFYQAFVLLEDQRIESMLITRARAVKPYLQAAIANYVLENSQHTDVSAVLLWGRKYLGDDVIQASVDAWGHGPELLAEAQQIIDDYRVLNLLDSDDALRAVTLSVQMMHLLRKIKPPSPDGSGSGLGTPHGSGHNHGGADSSSPQDRKRNKAANDAVKEGQDKNRGGQGGSKQDQQGPGGKQQRPDGSGGQGQDGPDGPGGEDEGDGQGSGQGDEGGDGQDKGDQQQDGYRAGTERGTHDFGTTLEDLLRVFAAGHGDIEQVEADYESYRALARVGRTGEQLAKYSHWGKGSETVIEATAVTAQIARQFVRLRELADPGWNYRTDAGRFNISRYVLGERDADRLHDEWEEGNDEATSVEAVVLLDISSSMKPWQDLLSASGWTIKRSGDEVDMRLTVIAYDVGAYYIYQASDRARPQSYPALSCTGGTNPFQAILEAYQILSTSPRKKKYLFTMTDGEWVSYSNVQVPGLETAAAGLTCDDLVASINAIPRCVTHMVYFGSGAGRGIDWHNHKLRNHISAITDLPLVFRDGVSALIAARR